MKFSRFAALCAVASALSTSAFAAGSISISNLTGQARTIVNGETVVLKDGASIEPGAGIETNTGSSIQLTLSGGVKLTLSQSTRLRIKSFHSAAGLVVGEIVLLRGNIAGDASGLSSASNLTVRTTAGAVNVAGTSFGIGFTPTSLNTGEMSAVSSAGNLTVTPVSATGSVSVPAGSQISVGASGAPITSASPATLAALKAAIASGKSEGSGDADGSTPGSGSASVAFVAPVVTVQIPNLAIVAPNGKLITISPNGEGAVQ